MKRVEKRFRESNLWIRWRNIPRILKGSFQEVRDWFPRRNNGKKVSSIAIYSTFTTF